MTWIKNWFKLKRRDGYKSVILQARKILLDNGTAKALRFLAESPEADSEEVIQEMISIAYKKQFDNELASFWKASFLDPIFCQCSLCDSNWLIPPESNIPASIEPQLSVLGVICHVCGRVLCSTCTKISGPQCTCGNAYAVIRRPNGRKHVQPNSSESYSDFWELPEIIEKDTSYLHLYYGNDGRVPIGSDPTFPQRQIAPAENHLGWAEALINAGCYYQAQQQLDLLGADELGLAKAQYLRARLELVQYQNARKFRQSYSDYRYLPEDWYDAPERIKRRLEEAIQLDPNLGEAWLSAAQVYINPECGTNYERALECIQRAEACLGTIGAVLLVKGKVLRELGNPSEAARVLSCIPIDSAEVELIKQERDLAESEVQSNTESLDAKIALKLGRWYIRVNQHDRARSVFTRLVELCPDQPEGYYGLAKLAFLNFKYTQIERYNQAYDLCQEALKFDPNFGLAYELLGTIFQNLSFSKEKAVSFKIEEYVDYFQRAVRHDPTCDIAFSSLGEECINQGELHPAIEMLEQAAALDTNASSVYFYLTAIYFGLRQYEKADWAQRKAKELAPSLRLSADYQQKIQKLCGFEY